MSVNEIHEIRCEIDASVQVRVANLGQHQSNVACTQGLSAKRGNLAAKNVADAQRRSAQVRRGLRLGDRLAIPLPSHAPPS